MKWSAPGGLSIEIWHTWMGKVCYPVAELYLTGLKMTRLGQR